MKIDTSSLLQIIAILASTLTSIISIIISVISVRKNAKANIEAKRAYVVFYIEKYRTNFCHTIILKNFGKTSANIIEISINPNLDYSDMGINNLTPFWNNKNIYLAPYQSIQSLFNFKKCPNKIFDVKIKYETLGKTYTDTFNIDLSYSESVLTSNPQIKSSEDALIKINESIREVSDKLSR